VINEVLAYQKRGMSIIPLKPNDKRPLVASWKDYQKKPLNIGDLRGFWKETPEANVGIITGSVSGVTVVDVDGEKGRQALINAGISLPETYTVQTPKGWHYYYRYNNLFKTGAGFLDNVDVRNDGGYVVAPPSAVNDTDYVVIVDNNGEFSEYGVVPEVFIDRKSGSYNSENKKNIDPWIADALANGAPEGQRNLTATRLAGYFWSRGIQEDIIKSTLLQFARNCTPQLSEKDIADVLASVMRYQQTKVRAFTDGVIPPPLCKVVPNGDVDIVWADNGVRVTFSRISRSRERLSCEITVTSHQVGDLLGPVAFDLMSMSKRKEAVSALNSAQPEEWGAILDVACRIARNAQDDTAEFIESWKEPFDGSFREWLVPGLLPDKVPTVVYAGGGSGKSLVGIATAMSVSSMIPIIDGIEDATDTGGVLFLDWENDHKEFQSRANIIAKGVTRRGLAEGNLDREDFPVTYHRCVAPLTTMQPKIERWVEQNAGKLIVIDSLVPALDGDANDSETARRFMNTLRSFNCASLIISHTSKEGKMFGSTFWFNLSRNVWEVEKEENVGQNYTDIALVHKKSNNSKLLNPIGIRLQFFGPNRNPTEVTFEQVNVIDTSGKLAESIPTKARIINLLKKEGAMSVSEIVDELGSGVSKERATRALTRGRDSGLFVHISDAAGNNKKWGLKQI
tara:strand:+ start:272 stop:2314 length:2043 start_codon:yes stop_codon:yes gene_type:complete